MYSTLKEALKILKRLEGRVDLRPDHPADWRAVSTHELDTRCTNLFNSLVARAQTIATVQVADLEARHGSELRGQARARRAPSSVMERSRSLWLQRHDHLRERARIGARTANPGAPELAESR